MCPLSDPDNRTCTELQELSQSVRTIVERQALIASDISELKNHLLQTERRVKRITSSVSVIRAAVSSPAARWVGIGVVVTTVLVAKLLGVNVEQLLLMLV